MQQDISRNRFETTDKTEKEAKNLFKSNKKKYESNKPTRWSSLQVDNSPKNTFKDRKFSEFKKRSASEHFSRFRSVEVKKPCQPLTFNLVEDEFPPLS